MRLEFKQRYVYFKSRAGYLLIEYIYCVELFRVSIAWKRLRFVKGSSAFSSSRSQVNLSSVEFKAAILFLIRRRNNSGVVCF